VKPAFTLEQVRSFLAVAEHESVSRAAASLHLTQGAVSQQLQNFEAALGLSLVERGPRGVRLTGAGRSLAPTCRGALRSVEVVAEAARALKNLEAGSLHLGSSPTCATYYWPSLLAKFAASHPEVGLSMTVEPSSLINEQVSSGVLECALIEGPPLDGLTAVVLAWDELVLVASSGHPLAHVDEVTEAELARHRYLGRGRLWGAESQAREMIGEAYERSEVLNLGHPEYVRAAALAGLGYAALPVLAVKADVESGTLVRLPGPSRKRPITAIRRPADGGPTVEVFWRFILGGAQPGPAPEPT
jgi:DNA-binding transcriptional LysR family regulator